MKLVVEKYTCTPFTISGILYQNDLERAKVPQNVEASGVSLDAESKANGTSTRDIASKSPTDADPSMQEWRRRQNDRRKLQANARTARGKLQPKVTLKRTYHGLTR